MSRNVYSEIFLHIVWRTKDSMPLIAENIENELYAFIRNRCSDTPGVALWS